MKTIKSDFIKKYLLNIINKYKEIIMYLIFGVLTTVVNFIVYILFAWLLNLDETISNGMAWFVSVVFAYITNKIWVFESKSVKIKILIYEILSFFGCRAFSGIMDIGLFYVLVKIVNFNDIISKCLIAVLVIVVNYVFSKLIIFKDKKGVDNCESTQ